MALSRLGLVKTTLIDFPGQVAATVFTPGCNLRCPYCHNPELVTPPFSETLLPIEEVRRFLQKRAAVLGGVCITGGEPLLYGKAYGEMVYGGTEEGKLQNSGDSQRSTEEPAGETGQQNASAGGLFEFILFCRQLGLKVKLDTNGCFPERLRPLLATGTEAGSTESTQGPGNGRDTGGGEGISGGSRTTNGPLLDYIAMDIKTLPERYHFVHPSAEDNAVQATAQAVRQSINLIVSSGIQHEFRTTMAPGIASPDDVVEIACYLKSAYTSASSVPRSTNASSVSNTKANGSPVSSSIELFGRYILTQFRPGKTLKPDFSNLRPYYNSNLYQAAEKIRKMGLDCEVRGC